MKIVFLNIVTRLISKKTLNPKQYFFPKGYILLHLGKRTIVGFPNIQPTLFMKAKNLYIFCVDWLIQSKLNYAKNYDIPKKLKYISVQFWIDIVEFYNDAPLSPLLNPLEGPTM